jgi:hypothetical protein
MRINGVLAVAVPLIPSTWNVSTNSIAAAGAEAPRGLKSNPSRKSALPSVINFIGFRGFEGVEPGAALMNRS